MKRVLLGLLVLVSLFALCSCAIQKTVCYYAYFKDTAFLLIYSSEKNTLYKITVPPEIISQYGKSQNIAQIPDAMRSFAGIEESGFILGIPQTYEAALEILDAMSEKENPTAEDRLRVITERAADLSNASLLQKLNSLCGTDLSALINALRLVKADVCILDASSVIKMGDPEFSQKYFTKYLTQVMGK